MSASAGIQTLPPSWRENNLSVVAVVAGAYAALQLLSNVASLKVGTVWGFAVDMGTFCYPFTFTLRDVAHKTLGKKAVTALVVASAVLCLFASGYLALCALAPDASGDGNATAFSRVFSPMWRLILASIAAMLVSELADTQVYHWFVQRTARHQWARVLLSNAVSIPLDNLVFAVGAFGWTLPWTTVAEIFVFNLVVKAVVGALGTPLIYLVREHR